VTTCDCPTTRYLRSAVRYLGVQQYSTVPITCHGTGSKRVFYQERVVIRKSRYWLGTYGSSSRRPTGDRVRCFFLRLLARKAPSLPSPSFSHEPSQPTYYNLAMISPFAIGFLRFSSCRQRPSIFFGTRHEYFPYEDVAKSGGFHHQWCISHSTRLPCIKCILPPFVLPRTPTVPELSLPGPDETHSTFSESAGKRSRLAAQPRPTTRSLAVQGLHPC